MNRQNEGNHQIKATVLFYAILVGLFVNLSGCATTGDNKPEVEVNKLDPYEGFNRRVFGFNDSVDSYVAKPISDAYLYVTPKFVQTGVANFFTNLKNINVVLNDFLQAKFSQGAADTGRFAVNSTFGLVGLFDIAKELGLEQHEEDFDQTLAVWGVPPGSYLVLPFLGPSTTRGVPGAVFDTATNPTSYIGAPVQLISLLNTRANAEGSLKFINEAALDPYVFTREAFFQWRKNLAVDGKPEASIDSDLDNLLGDDDVSVRPEKVKSGVEMNNNHDTSNTDPTLKSKDEFGQVSESFGNVTESFKTTVKSFEKANNKLDSIKVK
ncbi:MAG: VacJ family lipoprotein [Methylococcaceae bacterium]|jgi:phospholipid-binding lipoprotein MlaA